MIRMVSAGASGSMVLMVVPRMFAGMFTGLILRCSADSCDGSVVLSVYDDKSSRDTSNLDTSSLDMASLRAYLDWYGLLEKFSLDDLSSDKVNLDDQF